VKKIIGLGIAVAVVIALVTTGTFALFSDTETADDNTFTAGTLDLQVGDNDPCTESVSLGSDISPTDSGNAAIWLTKNIGSIAGDLSISLGAITNNENTRSEVETAAGDTTDGATSGELGGLLKVAFWMDVDKDASWSSGDYYLPSTSGTKVSWSSGTTLPTAAYAILDDYGSDSWTDVQTSIAGGTDIGNFRIEYDFPDGGSSDNVAQSDDCVFDITFDLEQITP